MLLIPFLIIATAGHTFDLNLNRVYNVLGIAKPKTAVADNKLVKLFDDGDEKTTALGVSLILKIFQILLFTIDRSQSCHVWALTTKQRTHSI